MIVARPCCNLEKRVYVLMASDTSLMDTRADPKSFLLARINGPYADCRGGKLTDLCFTDFVAGFPRFSFAFRKDRSLLRTVFEVGQ